MTEHFTYIQHDICWYLHSAMLEYIMYKDWIHMWCDQEKWVGTSKYWFQDIGKQSGLVSLFSIVFTTFQLPVSLKPIAQSPWGFSPN